MSDNIGCLLIGQAVRKRQMMQNIYDRLKKGEISLKQAEKERDDLVNNRQPGEIHPF